MEFIGFDLVFISTVIVLIVSVIAAIGFFVWQILGRFDMWPGIVAISMCIVAVMSGIVLAVTSFPYQSKYYSMYEISGEVTHVSNSLSEDGGELTRKVIVVLEDYYEPIIMDNPRGVVLENVDVTLVCSYEFVQYGMDNTNCDLKSINR